jgi:hypothetical protein
MATSTSSNLCLVCLFYSKYNFFETVIPIQSCCKHLQPKTVTNSHFKISKFWFSFNVAFAAFLAFSLCSDFVYVPKICQNETSNCLIFVADELFGVTSVLFILIMLCSLNVCKNEFNLWLFIFEYSKRYGLAQIFLVKNIRQMKLRQNVAMVSLYLLIMVEAVLHYFRSFEDSPLSYVRKFTIIMCHGIQSFGLYSCTQKCNFIGALFKTLEESVRDTLVGRLLPKSTAKNNVLKNSYNFFDLINKNIHLSMSYMSRICLMWIMTSVTSLILVLYIFIKYQDYSVATLSALQIRTGVTILGIIFLLDESENALNEKVSLIFYILFFFNICKRNSYLCIKDKKCIFFVRV